MKVQDYKETLKDAVIALHQAENEIFTATVNVAFSGEYKDISEVHDEGEIVNMEMEFFESSDDVNVKTLAELVKRIFEVKNTLMNLNVLDIDLDAQ